eukprot:TRINITY_DN3579_c0_g1_i1.p1 TRINITY_DN3579_c0_g1~~TRINITY_DN3579_c0_g1_i1.p1  ORF type:complete len:597 (+),score=172.45 TRINITY_DN3579_c0_g1_i1:59-1849(+)
MMKGINFGLFLLISTLCVITFADNHYKDGELVTLWVDKVGPFDNPQETYSYLSLPFCHPSQEKESRENLGEALQGYELIASSMPVQFQRDVDTQEICPRWELTDKEVKRFDFAVRRRYWYQMFLDDLPIFGMVGDIPGEKINHKGRGPSKSLELLLYTHSNFTIHYNGDQIISVDLRSENPIKIEKGMSVHYTYSVTWIPTKDEYLHRFDKYLDNSFFEHQIHWFSIFNSFMMVIFLVGMVSMILLRTLRKDYARYTQDDDLEDREMGDENGWKQVHGDVFRPPPKLVLFSALVGTGHQLAVLVFLLVLGSAIGTTLHLYEFYAHRGTSVTIFIVLYALTSFIGGYGGGGYYARNEGKRWIKVMVLTSVIFPGFCFLLTFFLNFIALGYGSLASIPIGTTFALIAMWAFLSVPMTLFGTVIGRNLNGKPNHPCRINPVPRHIPEKVWYLESKVLVLLGGLLPFGSIFIENYFIFTSFWHHKYYYVYGFMLLVYCMLTIVTVCVTIVSTYLLLNAEDYRWQWNAFLSGASTAFFVFLYSIYYFIYRTKMSGLLQVTFYFGYTFMFCVGLGILCGSIGFIGTSIFVRHIYLTPNVKFD